MVCPLGPHIGIRTTHFVAPRAYYIHTIYIMALFTQEAIEAIHRLGVMWFQTASPTTPFYGQPLPPGPPIATSAWYRNPNEPPDRMFPGILNSFFNRTGTYSTRNVCLKPRAVRCAAFAVWSWICSAAHRIRGESPAFKKQLANQENSQLYRLPVELLELVGEQLPPVSRLCMRRACSKFRTCLERLGPELRNDVLLRTEVLQFNLLLKQDARHHLQHQYNQRCDSADSNSQLYQRGCSGCLKIHRNSDDFSTRALSAALTISPKTRVCVGLEGSIDLCEHISFSTECLIRGLRDFRNLAMHCQMHRLLRGTDGNRCCRLERDASYGPRIEYYDGTKVTIDRRFYLFSVPVGTKNTHQELFDALRVIDGAICPHLRTSSPHLFHGKELTAECTRGVYDDPNVNWHVNWLKRPCAMLTDSRPNERKCIFWSKCPNQECDTWFGLRRLYTDFYPIHHVILEVKRSFVGDPTHPSWKAQIRLMEHGVEVTPKTNKCISRYSSCKGPVCAARHHGLVITPLDLEGTM